MYEILRDLILLKTLEKCRKSVKMWKVLPDFRVQISETWCRRDNMFDKHRQDRWKFRKLPVHRPKAPTISLLWQNSSNQFTIICVSPPTATTHAPIPRTQCSKQTCRESLLHLLKFKTVLFQFNFVVRTVIPLNMTTLRDSCFKRQLKSHFL